MKIYLTRHGQTDLNKEKIMQGRVDEPLNENGMDQARRAKEQLEGVSFDAVYASPLLRARQTASILSGLPMEDIIVDPRIIEVDFGKYERKSYYKLGIPMTLYWMYPEIFPCPKTVEDTKSMVVRSRDFLDELKKKDYENVLVVCHGGIIRALCGILEGRRNGIKWRPKPKNVEIRVYEV